MHPFATINWPAKHLVYRRSVGVPLPSCQGELVDLYGPVLSSGLKGQPLGRLLAELGPIWDWDWRNQMPDRLDCNAVWDLLGITYGQWCGALNYLTKQGVEILPVNAVGLTSIRAEFRTEDILDRIAPRLRGHRSPRLYPARVGRAFEARLFDQVTRTVGTWEKTWPEGVPRDNDDFYRTYRDLVEKTLNRYIRPHGTQSRDDCAAHVWLKLLESRCLEKFLWKAAFRKLPERLTAEEAVEFLGISWDCWFDLVAEPWIQPIEGERTSQTAVFSGSTIRMIEGSGICPRRPAIPPDQMGRAFRGYLCQATYNHFANWCRLHTRRFNQDQPLAAGARVIGGRLGQTDAEDPVSWDAVLEDPNQWDPAALDSKEILSGDGDCWTRLHEQVARINRTCSGRQDDVYAMVASGLTLREAIHRVQQEIRTRQRVI